MDITITTTYNMEPNLNAELAKKDAELAKKDARIKVLRTELEKLEHGSELDVEFDPESAPERPFSVFLTGMYFADSQLSDLTPRDRALLNEFQNHMFGNIQFIPLSGSRTQLGGLYTVKDKKLVYTVKDKKLVRYVPTKLAYGTFLVI